MTDRREDVAQAMVAVCPQLEEASILGIDLPGQLADAAIAAMTAEPTEAEIRAALIAYEYPFDDAGVIDRRWPAMRAALIAARKVSQS